jgi:hypothetical protein
VCFAYFSGRVLHFCPGSALDCYPPAYAFYVAGITNMYHHAKLIYFANFLCGLASTLDLPDLCLLSSWVYKCELSLPILSVFWVRVLLTLPMQAWNSRSSYLYLRSSWDYRCALPHLATLSHLYLCCNPDKVFRFVFQSITSLPDNVVYWASYSIVTAIILRGSICFFCFYESCLMASCYLFIFKPLLL